MQVLLVCQFEVVGIRLKLAAFVDFRAPVRP